MHAALTGAKDRFSSTLEHLKAELSSVRSGRATPSLVEHITVEAYGTLTPLIELASISAPEPRLVVVSPWDKGIVKDVERALQQANLGVSPIVDGAVVRLNFPPLSEERRRELVKVASQKLEEAKVAIRGIREEAMKQLKDAKAEASLPEDEFFAQQKELQKLVEAQNELVKEQGLRKEQEVMTI